MKSLFTFLACFFFFSAALMGQATLSVQGTIQKSFGGAVDDGKYSLTFKLYTAESGGTAVWSETQDGIEVIGGVYSALLGSANPLTAGFNTVYYLGISVDGGQELTPRTRLTSAPYALSLIGQSNTFPSAGPVGVGTVSPSSGNQLHVNNASDHTGVLFTSPADKSSTLRMNAGDKTGYLSVNPYSFNIGSENLAMNLYSQRVHLYEGNSLKAYTYENGLVVNGKIINSALSSVSGQDLRIERAEDLHILCRGDGYTEFKKSVYVPGAIGQYFGGVNVMWSSTFAASGLPFQNQSHGISIRGDQNIAAPNFIAYSDRRIKKDFRASSGSEDLATLMQLEVTNYRHIDTLAKGSGEVKGFIAQQVETVFPQAVSASVDVIPDILSKPAAIQMNGTEATLTMPTSHRLELGNRVRILQDGGTQMEYDVIGVKGNAFTVKDWNTAFTQPEKVFVYGKQVNDFRTVDYDKIHNLNVSATQELARRVAQLEAENAALRQKTGELDGLRSELNDMKARFSKLESLLISNANR